MSFHQQLYDQLCAKVAPNKKFLLFKVAQNWDWPPDANVVSPAEHELVGTMPALVDEGEDPFYTSSGTDIYGAYKTALFSVKIDTTEEQEELNQIDSSMEGILAEQQKVYGEYLAAWKASGLSESHQEEWKKESGWGLKLSMHMNMMPAFQKEEQSLLDSFNGTYNAAITAIKEKDGFAKIMRGDKMKDVPNFIVSENGLEWRVKVANGQSDMTVVKLSTSHQSTSPAPKKTFKDSKFLKFLNKITHHKVVSRRLLSYNSQLAQPQIGPSGLFLVNSMQKWKPLSESVDIESDNTNIDITFEAFTMVNVKPDPDWYYSAYLNKVGQSGSWRDGRTTEQVFGSGGFHSVITGFVAVYRPSFVITTSSKFYTKIKAIVANGGRFSLGPFSFGTLSPSSDQLDYTSCVSEKTIVIQSKFPYGQIVGVSVQNPYENFN